MDQIDDMTVNVFLEKLAASSFPSPASGSAAATTAAMAAALLEMSFKVTMKSNEHHTPLTLNEITETRNQCLALATEDMKALTKVIQAAKSSKEFPKEYEIAMKNGTEPLVSIVKMCDVILNQIELLIPICNKRVFAELIGSLHMTEAGQRSAKLGVEANLHLLTDEGYKESVQNRIQESYENSMETKERIMKFV